MIIQEIDFLPARYRQMQQCRQQKLWRHCVLVVFVLLIAAGAYGQRQSRLALEKTRINLRQHADLMASQLVDPQTLRDETDRLDARANVLAFLRVRVPPTRMLAAVTNTLPKFVMLTEFSMKIETLPVVLAVPGHPPAPHGPAAAAPEQSPAEKDFSKLQKHADENGLFATIAGVAPDDISIASYLAAMQATGFFSEVTLLYTDQHVLNDQNLRRFGVRLRVHKFAWPTDTDPTETPPALPPASPGTSPAASPRTADSQPKMPSLICSQRQSAHACVAGVERSEPPDVVALREAAPCCDPRHP